MAERKPAGKKRGLPGPGRTLEPRSDTERLELLVKLLGWGQRRGEVSIDWGEDGKGPLALWAGPAHPPQGRHQLAKDPGGDLRQLLDRALSEGAVQAPRGRQTAARQRRRAS